MIPRPEATTLKHLSTDVREGAVPGDRGWMNYITSERTEAPLTIPNTAIDSDDSTWQVVNTIDLTAADGSRIFVNWSGNVENAVGTAMLHLRLRATDDGGATFTYLQSTSPLLGVMKIALIRNQIAQLWCGIYDAFRMRTITVEAVAYHDTGTAGTVICEHGLFVQGNIVKV